MEYAGETNKDLEGDYNPGNKLDTTNKTNDENLIEGIFPSLKLFTKQDGNNETNQNESPVPKVKYQQKSTEETHQTSRY